MGGLGCPHGSPRGAQGTPPPPLPVWAMAGFGHRDFGGKPPPPPPPPMHMHILKGEPTRILAPGCCRSGGPDPPRGMLLPLQFLVPDLLPSLSRCRVQRRPGESEGAGEAGSWRKPTGAGCLEWAR